MRSQCMIYGLFNSFPSFKIWLTFPHSQSNCEQMPNSKLIFCNKEMNIVNRIFFVGTLKYNFDAETLIGSMYVVCISITVHYSKACY